MEEWKPITLSEILEKIKVSETELSNELLHFWKLVKVNPSKWRESEFRKEGNGFWVVAVCGNYVIWYNDIEEGFNISTYAKFGEINNYGAEQDQLIWCVRKLYIEM
jgi:DNA-binding transcriptional regulator GbsR (MarR family)